MPLMAASISFFSSACRHSPNGPFRRRSPEKVQKPVGLRTRALRPAHRSTICPSVRTNVAERRADRDAGQQKINLAHHPRTFPVPALPTRGPIDCSPVLRNST